MRAFDDFDILQTNYENAAKMYNDCRRKGIQGSHIDYLISSVAKANNLSIFTTDKDFKNYDEILGLKLHKVRDELK